MKTRKSNLIIFLFIMVYYVFASPMRSYAANQSQDSVVKLKLRNICYPASVPCAEDIWNYYQQRERVVEIKPHQIALILIDTWQHEDQITPHVHENNIIINKIVPVLKAAREADLVVIHAPHRNVTPEGIRIGIPIPEERRRNPDLNKLLTDQKLLQRYQGSWPPVEFIYKCGKYNQFNRNVRPSYMVQSYVSGIHEAVRPVKRKREFIESNLNEVRKILKREGILHLVYVGFATNECIIRRSVGIHKMASLGFNVIILRDATLGTELADISITHKITEGAILDIEKGFGFSATSEDLIRALKTSNAK
jgi:nicotinamidase-related amidase